jgi:hypothetical protein
VDEDCVDEVAGSALDLLIEFTADPVEKASESASAD